MPIIKTMNRRSALRLLGSAATLAAAPAITTAQAKTSVKVLLGWSWWPPFVPLIVGNEKGFFDKAGLDVEFRQGTGSGTTSQIVGQGAYEIGHVNLSSAAQAISRGVPIRAIATVISMGTPGMAFRHGRITQPSDVIGKRIGSTPGGSDSHILPAFLAANKISPDQVRVVNMPGEAKLGALIGGQIDIISGDAIYFAALGADKGVELDFFAYGEYGANTIGDGFITSESYMKSNADTLRRFIPAAMQAYAYTEANMDEAVALYRSVTQTTQSPETVRRVYEGYIKLRGPNAEIRDGVPTGRNDPAVWEGSIKLLSTYAGLKSGKPSSDYWTNQFLRG